MKQALCLQDLNDFNRLSDQEIETVAVQFVDRAICELPETGFFQLIPYVSFSHFDGQNGKFDLAIYRRPGSGDGEARLQGNTSCGFGGHIDTEDDLQFSRKEEVDGVTFYHMNLQDIKETVLKCAKRELREELGFDPITDMAVADNKIIYSLEREEHPDEVGQVHVCMSIKVVLEQEQFAQLMKTASPDAQEITKLDAISLDVSRFIASFNVTAAMEHLSDQLKQELNMEAWSILVINSMFINIVGFVQNNWNFQDVMEGIFRRMQESAEAQAEDSGEVQDESDPEPVGDSDNVLPSIA